MDEIRENINSKKVILLARNIPVALVVGAAGFFGSHLVNKLLLKNIQVIGRDNLSTRGKLNLSKATENKNFHFIEGLTEDLELELERLDYLFIALESELSLKDILGLFKKYKSRLLLISSVELYDQKSLTDELSWLKKAEENIARVAKEHNLNARILRLGPLFGPGMDFETPDPIARLIARSLKGDLQKEVSLEFSSRALYIDDAIDLAIKCIFAGATAQKIFDGVLPNPVKVSEIKQILLDPLWHERRNFSPSDLPPWSTPNLEKTIKFLNWHPNLKMVEHLKGTLSYFKDNEIEVPEMEDEKDNKGKWTVEKEEELEAFKEKKKETNVDKRETKKGRSKLSFSYSKFLFLIALAIIVYGLIWPLMQLGWGVASFRFQLLAAKKALEKGEFDKSLLSVQQAGSGLSQANTIFYSLEPIRKTAVFKSQFELGDDLSKLANLSLDSAQNAILGVRALYQSLKSVTGELSEPPKDYFDQSRTYLASADEDLSKAFALLESNDFKSKIPAILKTRVDSLSERLGLYSDLIRKARALSILLPEVVGSGESSTGGVGKSYLVLLQNNNELRPTGGFIGSFAKINFEGGKLKKLEVNDIYALDGQLSFHVEPPKEIKEDLNQKDFFLRDSNWEPDFPSSARQAEWFYTKEAAERVEGVVALDISAMEDLLSVIGPLDLADYGEKISSDNLFERTISHAEAGFFPGSQAKKSFLTALTQSLLNKLFFLPNQNWPAIVASLDSSLAQKHMSIYLDNPKLFSYLVSQNWSSLLPRPNSEKGKIFDFLAPVEANLGANKANYYLDRSYKLETVIGKDGDVSHRLRISYTNRSPSSAFPAGTYKNRMRIYLPAGSKLTRVLWGEADFTKDVSSFADYGRAGLSFLLELVPKQQKTLVLDYQTGQVLEFLENQAFYRLDVVKQAGTLKDPFVWSITYPLSLKLSSAQTQKISPQEQTIQTDLSKDRSFEVEFSK